LSANGITDTCTYTTAGEDTFAVPTGVSQVTVMAVGGAGGEGLAFVDSTIVPGAAGGSGAQVSATLGVTGGSTLYTEVGSNGANAVGNAGAQTCSPGAGGTNGGGDGGASRCDSQSGGGGGGASDVRTSSSAALTGDPGTDPRLVVAGGGGGGGGGYLSNGGAGGAAGNSSVTGAGAGGSCTVPEDVETGGTGGVGSGGGAGGTARGSCAEVASSSPGGGGSPGTGGVGGNGDPVNSGGGGGGGGGFIGGGGGVAVDGDWDSGGGGGSSFSVDPNAVVTTDSTGVPSVTISYPVTSGPLQITTTSLPDGIVGQPYSFALQATGGNPPYTWWFAKGGDLPRGLHFSTAGVLSGTPKKAGNYSITFRVRDTKMAGHPVNKAHAALTVTITIT
jgi:hypothetical protein